MSTSGKINHQLGFILMSQPWRETSLLIEVFVRNYGRLTLIARSARRAQSSLRGLLMPFAPLELSWFGKSELRTLHSVEWLGGIPQLSGVALLSGFYLNELIVRLIARDDPHEKLFDAYNLAVHSLSNAVNISVELRRFELLLLAELGYAPTLNIDAEGCAIEDDAQYICLPGRLPMRSEASNISVSGLVLRYLASDDFSLPSTRNTARKLTCQWIDSLLPGGRLATRELLRGLDLSSNKNGLTT